MALTLKPGRAIEPTKPRCRAVQLCPRTILNAFTSAAYYLGRSACSCSFTIVAIATRSSLSRAVSPPEHYQGGLYEGERGGFQVAAQLLVGLVEWHGDILQVSVAPDNSTKDAVLADLSIGQYLVAVIDFVWVVASADPAVDVRFNKALHDCALGQTKHYEYLAVDRIDS